MSGPTLQLNITAPGQQKVEATISSIERLVAALRALPAASAEISKLNKALNSASGGPGGLKQSTGDLKELVGEIRNLSAQLNTSFGSLEETIKKGWGKAARAQEEGAAKAGAVTEKSAKAQVDRLKRLDAAYEAASVAGQNRLVLRARAQLDQGMAAPRVQSNVGSLATAAAQALSFDQAYQLANQAQERTLEKQHARRQQMLDKAAKAEAAAIEAAATRTLAAQKKASASYVAWIDSQIAANNTGTAKLKAAYDKSIATLRAKTAQVMKAASMEGYKHAGPVWWEQQLAQQDAGTAKLKAAYDKSIATLRAKTAQVMKAASMEGYKPAGPAWWAAQLAQQEKASASYVAWIDSQIAANNTGTAKLKAAYDKSIATLRAKTAQVMKAASMEGYKPAGPDWWEAQLAKQKASAAKYEAWIDSQIAANNAQHLRLQRQNAAFAAASQGSQARTVLAARSQLDQGIAPAAVKASFGSQALAAAQATNFASAYAQVHTKAKDVTEAARAQVPHIQNLSAVMRDGHSAARGLASGFGQMALTWGAIGPLLAGAALSQSFVGAVRTGLAVRQSLEELRVLSEESAGAVASLETQLISLGRTGPFGPKQVADAMKTLSLAGLNTLQVAQALKPALDFSITGGVGIQKASENLVAIGTAYGYQADQFSLVADAVAKAAAVSMSSVDSMMGSFRSSSIVAQAYGVTLKDTATSLALLANIGIRGTAAGTAMRQMYSELSGATASTRTAMRRLNVEVVDSHGKMKPLVTIVGELSSALAKYDGKSRIAAIQALSNERGSKAIVAALSAIEKKAQQAGTTVSNELQRIGRLIDESAGFNAISAAELASTPQNLMKGIASSFQTALLEAYNSLEPTLVLFAKQVRDVFNSQGFRDGIGVMVRGVGLFVSALVDGVKWLERFAWAFGTYKALQLFALALSGASLAAGLLNKSLVITSTGIMTAAAAATAGTTSLTGMAFAARALTMVLRVAGPLAIALTLAGFAYSAYGKAQKDARIVEAEATAARQANTLESLTQERDRLIEVTRELAKGTALREADHLATMKQAAAQEALANSKARAPYMENLQTALLKVDQESKLNGGKGRPMMMPLLKQQAAEAADALRAFDLSAEVRAKAIRDTQAEIQRMSLAVEIAKAGEEPPTKLGTEEWYRNASAAAAQHDSAELGSLKKKYDEQEKAADEAYRRQMELLDIKHKGQLVSESSYSNLSEQYAAQMYAAKTRSLETYVADSEALLGRLLANPKKDVTAKAAIAQVDAEVRQAQDQLAFLKEKNAAQQAARGNLLGAEVRTGLDALRSEVALQREKFDLEQRQVGLADSYVASEQAKLDVQTKGAAALKDLLAQYYLADQELGKVYAAAAANPDARGSALDETAEARLQAEIRRLRGLLRTAQDEIDAEAGKAGKTASDKALAAKNTWATYIAEGKNANRVLEDSRAEFMNGWVEQGRTVWADWLATGKLNLNSFGDLIKKTFAEITYKRFIAEPLSKMGNVAFDKLLKPTAETQPSDEGVAGAFRELSAAANGLGDSLGQLGGDFWQLVRSLGQSLAAMLQQAGATDAGAWVGKLFSGSGSTAGSTDAIPAGEMVNASGWALGGAFNQGVHAFAAGASFTNSIVNSPHVFRFGRGGSNLGVAGEAGPEAIMPLARDSSGSLGVRVHGGGAAPAGPKTIVMIENHGNGEAPQVTKQTQPNGDELVRVVLNATAKDIQKGGKVRKSIQGATKTTPNLPRY